MRRRDKADGKAAKTQRRKTLKRRNAPKTARRHSSLAGDKETNVEQLTRELAEAREREAATAEVLQVISSSPAELEPVFETILANATRLCDAKFGTLNLYDGEAFRIAAVHNVPPAFAEARLHGLIRPHPGGGHAELVRTKQVVHIKDIRALQPYREGDPAVVAVSDVGGARTIVLVPMLKGDVLVGVITIFRQEVRPFTNKQIDLVSNFAKQAVIAIENTRLLNELRHRTDDLSEALEQQIATSEVLKVISSSPGELKPVFEAMLENAVRICSAKFGILYLAEGDVFRIGALHGVPPAYAEVRRREPIIHLRPGTAITRASTAKQPVQIADVQSEAAYHSGDPSRADFLNFTGARTVVVVPMLKDDQVVGVISIYRQEVHPFTDKQIELVKNFASQAVIAIENTRLLSELRQRTDDLSEALEQQTATSEVLKVISSSAGELEPVFQTMLANATRICEAAFGSMLLVEDGARLRRVAIHNAPPTFAEFHKKTPVIDPRKIPDLRQLIETKRAVHVADAAAANPDNPIAKYAGARSLLVVPMLKDGNLVGAISIYRQEVRPFTDKQIELVENFAAQAVIAIENARLLNELRQRTDDLSESLQQQTATADVLKVISRSTFDLETVLNTLLASAARLCEGHISWIFQRDGEVLRWAASYGHTPEVHARIREFFKPLEVPVDRSSVVGRAASEAAVVHIHDVLADHEYKWGEAQKIGGYRAALGAPLLRDGKVVGILFVAKTVPQPFTVKQVELVKTFADQAVIAIENTRLLNELRESLQQQTATADVLKVISSSPGELEPVFDAMLANATRICEATIGTMYLYEGTQFRGVALHHSKQSYVDYWRRNSVIELKKHSGTPLDRLANTKRVVHIPDLRSDQSYLEKRGRIVALVEDAGVRTFVSVPMLKEGELVGAINLYRQEVRPFTDKQINLVENFASQAVIAIENTRLLSELRESLQQQTATADVLKVISRSTFDLQVVLDTLTESAARLCEADMAAIVREKDTAHYWATSYGFPPDLSEYLKSIPVKPGRGSVVGRILMEGKTVHVSDALVDPEYTYLEAQKKGGYRTMLGVPLLREGMPLGVLLLMRRAVQPFTDKQIELVSTFADQAVIAIENVRLFESVETRTRELADSLENLRTTQDRLVQTQKLASLGQLTAGIAHEIKNPLNFVNNFSVVSSELIDELRDTLKGPLDDKARAEINELTDTLRSNLDKVVQHGKRADAIVKNMLLHSREGSGEHRVVDINALVEESLNLAYHGARAEKQGFNITLERSLDATAGEVDVFPQDITRVLLNLISNGFYAAMKRKTQANNDAYEPTLAASTRSLGDHVEICIRDNGTGISPDVKERIFNPFFTTKPAGEGTGLGLSISHDIVVKQHGGSIEVDTQPGAFTEFRIILPRTAAAIAKSGERA